MFSSNVFTSKKLAFQSMNYTVTMQRFDRRMPAPAYARNIPYLYFLESSLSYLKELLAYNTHVKTSGTHYISTVTLKYHKCVFISDERWRTTQYMFYSCLIEHSYVLHFFHIQRTSILQ